MYMSVLYTSSERLGSWRRSYVSHHSSLPHLKKALDQSLLTTHSENHQKKLGLTCAFFLAPDPNLTLPPKSRTKAPASSKSAPASTASRGKKSTAPNSVASTVRAGRSRAKVVVKEVEEEEEEEDEEEVEEEVVEEVEEGVQAEIAVVVEVEVSL